MREVGKLRPPVQTFRATTTPRQARSRHCRNRLDGVHRNSVENFARKARVREVLPCHPTTSPTRDRHRPRRFECCEIHWAAMQVAATQRRSTTICLRGECADGSQAAHTRHRSFARPISAATTFKWCRYQSFGGSVVMMETFDAKRALKLSSHSDTDSSDDYRTDTAVSQRHSRAIQR